MTASEIIRPLDILIRKTEAFGDTLVDDIRNSNLKTLIALPQLTISIIQEHDDGEQVRRHHKRRINKKWLKRYGVYGKQILKKGEIFEFNGVIYMSRQTFTQLKKELKRREEVAEGIKNDSK